MAISKILDFSAGSKFAIKLPQAISNDWESQNCDWVLFSVTPLLNLADSLPGVFILVQKVMEGLQNQLWNRFANAILVQSITSNLHQKCSFKHFKIHQNREFRRVITCQIVVLVPFEMFKWALLVQIRSNTLHQYCIDEANPSRGSDLFQTLFGTRNYDLG